MSIAARIRHHVRRALQRQIIRIRGPFALRVSRCHRCGRAAYVFPWSMPDRREAMLCAAAHAEHRRLEHRQVTTLQMGGAA